MKTLLSIGAIFVIGLAFAFSGSVGDKPSQAAMTLGNPDLMSIGCTTGYTRAYPHFCRINTPGADALNFTLGAGCNVTAFTTYPATATGLQVQMQNQITASNVVNLKTQVATLWTDAGCVSTAFTLREEVREQVVSGAGNMLLNNTYVLDVVPLVSGQVRYTATSTNTGAGAAIGMSVVGYFD